MFTQFFEQLACLLSAAFLSVEVNPGAVSEVEIMQGPERDGRHCIVTFDELGVSAWIAFLRDLGWTVTLVQDIQPVGREQ